MRFGHYKAQAQSIMLATFRCKLINLVIKNKVPLERWLNGISIMLEKMKGIIQVDKLRAILLLEADLNALHKIMFNGRVLPALEEKKLIPIETIGSRGRQSAHHVALGKKLISDIGNQIKLPMITISADATNCFDRMAHPFAALTCRHFGLQIECVLTYLGRSSQQKCT